MIINEEYRVMPGTINAQSMSMTTFINHLNDALEKMEAADVEGYPLISPDEDVCLSDEDVFPYTAFLFDASENGRLPYDSNIENVTVEPDKLDTEFSGEPFLGLHMMAGNIPVMGVCAYSDYAPPVTMILYPDNAGNIAIYIPVRGNAVNLVNKSFIGEAFDSDQYMDDDAYLEQYGMTMEDMSLDFDAMREEIETAMK